MKSVTFTPAQQLAIDSDERDIVCIAGAGAGKTSVLVARIVRLLNQGASASQFCVFTFTRRASHEMQSRLMSALRSRKKLDGMLMGTFHSIGLRMLREHGERLGYHSGSLSVLDPDDADLLLESVCTDLGYYRKKVWKGGLSWQRVSKYRESWYSRMREDPLPELETIFKEYRSRLYQLNALDFGSILLQANRLLDIPDVKDSYTSRIKWVLADETQDESLELWSTHRKLAPPCDLFRVGDYRQCIYKWRGARPELMLKAAHESTTTIVLQDNFRSGSLIVEAANKLIKHSEPDLAPMISATGRDGEVFVSMGDDMQVAALVELAHEKGYGYGDIAILARKHALLMNIGQALREKEIPMYRVGQGFSITETPEFRDLHAALKLSVNEHDTFAFLRVARRLNIDIANVSRQALADGVSQFSVTVDKHPLLAQLSELNGLRGMRRPTITDLLVELLQADEMASISAPAVDFWIKHCSEDIASDALDWYATRDQQDDVIPPHRVTLLTCHAAKGLEWPCVIVAGLNEGILPGAMSIRANEVDDERRVCYVGVTRAAEMLMLHWYEHDEQGRSFQPSRFLPELGVPLNLPA